MTGGRAAPWLVLVGSLVRVAAGSAVLWLAGSPLWGVLLFVFTNTRLRFLYVREPQRPARRSGDADDRR